MLLPLQVIAWSCCLAIACDRPRASVQVKPATEEQAEAGTGGRTKERTGAQAKTPAAGSAAVASAPVADAAGSAAVAPAPKVHAFRFDVEPVNQPPTQLGIGVTGRPWPPRPDDPPVANWLIVADPTAPSRPHVLAQLDTATAERLAVAVPSEPSLRDGAVSVRCKLVGGRVEQVCGVVFRQLDVDNYYVARASALAENVRLYHVVRGDLQPFASWHGRVTLGTWHALRVIATGARFQVFWDDQQVLDARDDTFGEPGAFGVWTSADSVTYFDDLTATPS